MTATIHMPTRGETTLAEGGKPLRQSKGVKFLRMENDRAILSVGSGSYHFSSKL